MLRRRYEILLPLTYNDGRAVSDETLDDTRRDLLERFEGVSFQPEPVQGTWIHQGQTNQDLSVKVVVDVDDTPENRAFFKSFKTTLLERFQQIEIYIVSYPVDIL